LPEVGGGRAKGFAWRSRRPDAGVALAAIAGLDLGSRAVAVAVLLNPVDYFRVLALSQVDVVAGGFGSVLAAAGLSVPVVAAALAGWVVVPVAVAARLLGRRRV
jgi:Cu-processing system permease protein